jgi:hypothetical protein
MERSDNFARQNVISLCSFLTICVTIHYVFVCVKEAGVCARSDRWCCCLRRWHCC